MHIYADVLLIINFVMNTFILWAAAKLARKKILPLRLLAGGGVMAALYVAAIFFLPHSRVLSLAVSVALLSIGVFVGCAPRNLREFLGIGFLAFLCSFTIGGFGMMFLDMPGAVPISWTLLAACIIGAYVIIKILLGLLENITVKKQMLLPLTINVDKREISLNALVDTGHTLLDPLSKAPVIVAEFESIKHFLPENLQLLFNTGQDNDLAEVVSGSAGSRFYNRIRLIPFASLGTANGMLVGFRPDAVAIHASKKRLRDDVVIGIYNRKLTASGRYQCLIGAELVA